MAEPNNPSSDGPQNDFLTLPTWRQRMLRRLQRYYDNPMNIFRTPGYNQYACNYYTTDEDIHRRQATLFTETSVDHPLIRLRPLIANKNINDDRDTPYYLRGRNDEFNHFAAKITNQPRGINVITGPPGVGKTTLLAALRQYAHHLGYIVIHIPAEHFRDRNTLCQSIRRDSVSQDDTGITTSHSKESHTELSTKYETVIPVDLQAGHKTQTTRDYAGEQQILDHIQEALAQNNRATGILITVDEMQNMLKPTTELIPWDNIATNFTALNDAVMDTEANLPIATIMAGLPPARRIYEKALSRPASKATLQLRPVTEADCWHIINDHLSVADRKGLRPAPFDPQLIAQYARNCQGHVLHATHAGTVLQKYGLHITRQGRSEPNNTDLDAIATGIQEIRHEHYQKLLDNADDKEIVNHLIIAAKNSPHNLLHPTAGTNIIKHILQKRNQPTDDNTIDRILLPLEARGVVQRVTPGLHFLHYGSAPKNQPHWEIPTPSMQPYVMDHIIQTEQQPQIEQTVKSILAQTPQPASIQPWRRNKEYIPEPVPTLPHKNIGSTLKSCGTPH